MFYNDVSSDDSFHVEFKNTSDTDNKDSDLEERGVQDISDDHSVSRWKNHSTQNGYTASFGTQCDFDSKSSNRPVLRSQMSTKLVGEFNFL